MTNSLKDCKDNGDKKITLIEAIQALRVTSGITEPAIKYLANWLDCIIQSDLQKRAMIMAQKSGINGKKVRICRQY